MVFLLVWIAQFIFGWMESYVIHSSPHSTLSHTHIDESGSSATSSHGRADCNILDFYENQKYELFKIFPVIMWGI